MEIIFSEVAFKQLKKLNGIDHDDVASIVESLVEDENFQQTTREALAEDNGNEIFPLSFYNFEYDITISTKFAPLKHSITILGVKRGNHMNI